MSLRPNAAAYARVAYALELRGDLSRALETMQMAFNAAATHDPEAQAWYATQLGELHVKMGRLPEADREFRRAVFVYPDYPLAMIGQGKVAVARGDRDAALTLYFDQLKRTPSLDLAARIGDLYALRADTAQAERYYQMAEDLAGPAIAQTEANLALFLAERGRRLPDAVKIAEAVASTRDDIFTADAMAWAYFKVGRLADARAAAERATRTGTKDERILFRAATIRDASNAQ
jgi:tetratricopeptide (TPR) repeat protein